MSYRANIDSFITYFRRFSLYFTILSILSFTIHLVATRTILSYVDFTFVLTITIALWGLYIAGIAFTSPNSSLIQSIRLSGPILLISAILMEYVGLIGHAINRITISYFLFVVVGLLTVSLISCARTASTAYRNSRKAVHDLLWDSAKDLSARKKGSLVGILLVAAGLRMHSLTNYSYIADETIHLWLSKSIHTTLLPTLPSGLLYIRSFIYSYLVSISTLVFGANEFGLRLPSVAIGVALVLLGYFGGATMFNRRTGLIAALLIAIDPFMISFSRIGRFYILFYFLATVTVVLFYTSFITNSTKKWTFGIAAILAVITHDLAVFLFPMFLFWWLNDQIGDSKNDVRFLDLAYFLFPMVVWLANRKLKNYTLHESVPGTWVAEISKPIVGVNIYNIQYYWEIIVNPYTVYILLAIIAIAYVLPRSPMYKYSYEVSYISSFVLMYLFVLGYMTQRESLRFIIVVVPLLLLLFGRLIDYALKIAVSLAENRRIDISLHSPRKELLTTLLLVALFTSNLFIGGILINHSYDITEIPDETESNWKLLEQHFHGNEYAFQSKVTHYVFMNTKDAAKYVAKNSQKNSIVISSSNFGPVHSYLPVDYNTNHHITSYLGYRAGGTRYDIYQGLPVITNVSMAKSIFDSERPVWIVADLRFEEHTRPEVEEYIKNNSRLVYVSPISNTSEYTGVFGNSSKVRVYYSPPSYENESQNRTSSWVPLTYPDTFRSSDSTQSSSGSLHAKTEKERDYPNRKLHARRFIGLRL